LHQQQVVVEDRGKNQEAAFPMPPLMFGEKSVYRPNVCRTWEASEKLNRKAQFGAFPEVISASMKRNSAIGIVIPFLE